MLPSDLVQNDLVDRHNFKSVSYTHLMEAFAEEAATVNAIAEIENEDGEIKEEIPVNISAFQRALATQEPDPADFGVWVPGIPVLFDKALEAMGTTDWLNSLILDGIVAGVGAVLGFVPQLLVLFLFLAFLEACGYMAQMCIRDSSNAVGFG